MSTKSSAELESDEKAQKRSQAEQFSYDVESPRMVEVTNESHDNSDEHQYVVTLDDVTGDAMTCTCPHHVHRNAFCIHMITVETATDDSMLDAFSSDTDDAETRYHKRGFVERCRVDATMDGTVMFYQNFL